MYWKIISQNLQKLQILADTNEVIAILESKDSDWTTCKATSANHQFEFKYFGFFARKIVITVDTKQISPFNLSITHKRGVLIDLDNQQYYWTSKGWGTPAYYWLDENKKEVVSLTPKFSDYGVREGIINVSEDAEANYLLLCLGIYMIMLSDLSKLNTIG